jgi:hypothetical protein
MWGLRSWQSNHNGPNVWSALPSKHPQASTSFRASLHEQGTSFVFNKSLHKHSQNCSQNCSQNIPQMLSCNRIPKTAPYIDWSIPIVDHINTHRNTHVNFWCLGEGQVSYLPIDQKFIGVVSTETEIWF